MIYTVNLHFSALGLYNFVRVFGRLISGGLIR